MADEVKTDAQATSAPEAPKENTPSIKDLTEQIKNLQSQLEKSKQAYNTASSDAADWKRKFRDTQDEATRKEADRNEEMENLKRKVAEFEKQTVVATNKAAYIAMGYPEDLASKKAQFLADNDIENAMKVERDFIEYHDKAIKSESLRNMTTPASGFASNATITKDQFKNMSLRERTQLRAEHPDVYEEMTKH